MKKITLVVSVLMTFTFMSCKKDYICICTVSSTGEQSTGDHFKANAITKKAAEESCKANNDVSGGTLKDCHLE